jgi:O-antigen ligase
MATRLKTLGREPGDEGLLRSFGYGVSGLLWGTDLRRTLTAVIFVISFVSLHFILLQGSAYRLLQSAGMLAVFFIIMLKPHVGVISLKIYRTFARGLRIEDVFRAVGVTVTKSIGLFTLIAFVALVATKKIKPVFGHKTQLIFIFGLLGASIISAFPALQIKTVWTHMFQMIENIILYIIFVNLFAEAKWLFRYTWFTILSQLATCITGLASVALGTVVRAAGAIGNANGLAMLANGGAALLLVLSLFEKDVKKKFLFLSGLAICMVTIVFTGSRGGLLTIMVTFAYQLIKRRKKLIPYLAAAAILVIAFALIPEKYTVRQEQWFGALLSGETGEIFTGSRAFIYQSAWDIFKKSPIIGVGPRMFAAIYQAEYAVKITGPAAGARALHSGILQVLVGMGLVGFFFFLGIIITTFWLFRANGRICRRAKLTQYILLNELYEAWFVAIIVSGSFETLIRGGQTFFVALAAAAVIHRAAKLLSAAPPERAALSPGPSETAPGATSAT